MNKPNQNPIKVQKVVKALEASVITAQYPLPPWIDCIIFCISSQVESNILCHTPASQLYINIQQG